MSESKEGTPAKAKGAPGRGGGTAAPRKMVAPDGGWGWVIVFAFALNSVMSIPLLLSFGLIFKDKFRQLNMTAADCTTIINANLALSFGLGLLNGPLLRRFSYRKVAITGSLFLFSGTILTGFATTFTDFIIFYSILLAFGLCFLGVSFSLAMNSYFLKRRGRATGLGVASMGLGPIVMPLIISHLLSEYSARGTMLVLAGLVLHSLPAALLLQPVRWHTKPAPVEEGGERKGQDGKGERETSTATGEEERESMINGDSRGTQGIRGRKKSTSTLSVDHDLDAHSIYGYEDPLVTPSLAERCYRRESSTSSVYDPRRRYNRSVSQEPRLARNYWWNSEEGVNLGSSYRIFDERAGEAEEAGGGTKGGSVLKRATVAVANFFDLDLLKDPIYVSIMMGMAASMFSELNFSMLNPFILNDFGLSTGEVATVMATIAGVDIVVRFMVPFIAERLKIHPRLMFIFSLVLGVGSRSLLLFFNTPAFVMGIAVVIGISKGIRMVYTPLIIPTYVSLERLPGASGIQMLMNGLVFTAGGPFIGLLRDYTGSYGTCLYLMNGVTLFTVLTWMLEYSISRKGFQYQV